MTTHDENAWFDELEASLDTTPAERWKPQPGDQIIGTVEAITYRGGNFGTWATITVRDPRTGQAVDVRTTFAALKRPLVDARTQTGDRIAIRYNGEQTGSNGQTFHGYTVRVVPVGARRPGEAFDPDNPANDPGDDLGLIPGLGG